MSGTPFDFEMFKQQMNMVKMVVRMMNTEEKKQFLAVWTIVTKEIMKECQNGSN